LFEALLQAITRTVGREKKEQELFEGGPPPEGGVIGGNLEKRG